MSVRERLQTKVAFQKAVEEVRSNPAPADDAQPDAATTSAAPAAPATVAELRAAWDRALRSDDVPLLARTYLNLYESLALAGARGDLAQWGVIGEACKMTLLRFSLLAAPLSSDTTEEPKKDEYVLLRAAVLLTSCTASLRVQKVAGAIASMRQLIQSLWERFEGLGVGGRQNLFLVQPIRMMLATLVDARMFSQAESVVEAIEELLRESPVPSDVLVSCPAVFRASETADGFLLPAFLRTRLFPCSEQIHTQAAGMGLIAKHSQEVRLNLRVLALRFRATHSDPSRADHARLTASSWLTIVNALSAQEDLEVKRPGFYSLDILPEAAEALEELNFLQPAAALLRRFEEYFQPLAQVRSGAEVKPSDLFKVPYEQHMQVVATHGQLLIKYALSDDASSSAASTVLPTQWPATPATALARYTEYYLLLQQRMLATGDLDNVVQSLTTQARDLAFAWTKPWDALKKIKEGLATLKQMYGEDEAAMPREAWPQLHTLHALQGTILSQVVAPPQPPAALEAFDRARALMLKHHAGLRDAQKVMVLSTARAHIHALIAHLVDAHINGADLHEKIVLGDFLRQLVDLQKEYLDQYHRQKSRLLGANTTQAEHAIKMADPKMVVACMQELDDTFASEASTIAAATSSSSLLSVLTPFQSQYLRSSHLLLELERLASRVSSGGKLVASDLQRLGRIDASLLQQSSQRRLGLRAQEQREVAARSSSFNRCSSPTCRLFHAPPAHSFLACSACRSASYCSRACQKQHWSTHKPMCQLKAKADAAAAAGQASQA